MALPEPKDDIEKLCLEIAQAMYNDAKDNPTTGFYEEWDNQSDDYKLYWLRLARIAMEMIGIHLKVQLMEVFYGVQD